METVQTQINYFDMADFFFVNLSHKHLNTLYNLPVALQLTCSRFYVKMAKVAAGFFFVFFLKFKKK